MNDEGRRTVVMNFEHFGDSYDFVKRGVLQLLANCGGWSAHPMFTDDDPAHYAWDYCRLVGVHAVETKSFQQVNRDRERWLKPARAHPGHLLIDPDTGLPFDKKGRPSHQGRRPAAAFLRATELVDIAKARPDKLTLVFDQSFHRKPGKTYQIDGKLRWLRGQCVYGLVYHSHATFFLVSLNPQVLASARHSLLEQLPVENHPKKRLIEI